MLHVDRFVNCLVKQFAMCFGVVAILLLNVIKVFSVCDGVLCWIHHVWSSKECACCVCDPSVHLNILFMVLYVVSCPFI